MKLVYPIHYRNEIRDASLHNKVDPKLIAAIIRVESNYNPKSQSHKGALGIMQLMPDTAEWLFAKDAELGSYRLNDLNDPQVNIQVGTRYVSYLNIMFKGNQAAVAAAYNAGQGKVTKWLQDNVWDGTLDNADRIPIMETRKYVKSVHYYYNKYSDLYGPEFWQP
jgi:soluble lytic murein transglycosylase